LNPVFICLSLRRDILWYTTVRPSVRPFHMLRSNLGTIDGLTVCILYGEILNFHSRVMGTLFIKLYMILRQFFVCRVVNWEPLGQFTSNFAQLLELIVLRSVYFLVKFRFFIPELWDLNYYSVLFQHKYCINVPIHVYWCSCWWNLDFSFKSYGEESLYKYCMNVDDRSIMRSWRSCLFVSIVYILNKYWKIN
jgi:hypothetical protein